jgi:Leucine-rich repeat (LRR) protein
LDDNQLMALPESFGRLESLRSLNLNGNQLTMLPKPILQLQWLQTLNLRGHEMWVDIWKEKRKRDHDMRVNDTELIAKNSDEVRAFIKQYPYCLGRVLEMNETATKNWISVHPSAFASQGKERPPKIPQNLWRFVLSDSHTEPAPRFIGDSATKECIHEMTVTVNPITRKIVGVETKNKEIIFTDDEDHFKL